MRLAILGPRKKGYEEGRLLKEGRRFFEKVDYFPIPNVVVKCGDDVKLIYKNKNLLNYDAILPRIPRSYKTYGFILLSLAKDFSYIPIEPFSVILSHNKFLTLLKFVENLLPVPKTFLALRRNVLEESLNEVSFPVVLKLLYGSKGIGVMFADTRESAVTIMDTLERFKQPIFLEEYVKNIGEDVRAYVIGEEIIAMKRIAKKDERRANISIGGKGEKYELQESEKKLVLMAAASLEMEICGIDFMHSDDGPILIESNVNAQFRGLESVTDANIARKIVSFIKEKVRR